LKKQGTRIAIYGIGHIKDVRLHYLLDEEKVKFEEPFDENDEDCKYFKILVIH
jgi:hypothetical protein